MYLGKFIVSPPPQYRIGLNALHVRTFSPIFYRKGGENMRFPKYMMTGIPLFALCMLSIIVNGILRSITYNRLIVTHPNTSFFLWP